MIESLVALVIALELSLYTQLLWRVRVWSAAALTFLIPLSAMSLFWQNVSWLSGGLIIIAAFRVLNMLRIAKARMHEQYLFRAARRTSIVLAILTTAALVQIGGLVPGNYTSSSIPLLVACVQAVAAIALVITTLTSLRSTRYRQGETFYADTELPTVSLLIPARNETTDLEDCLRSALASDYPKLEIIVLDDCSHQKTSDIIKGFAHKGVRFVKGSVPADRWLAKNQAYEKLRHEASGDVLLFCGVDVRFGPYAIKALVTEMRARNKAMISVLPHRLSGNLAGAFIQPMRYWWELSLPRKLVNRPPVLSTCWLIDKKRLTKLGGFGAVSHSIIPEAVFARKLVATNEYSFIRADDTLDMQTRKNYAEQRATALRTRYPQLRRRPEYVLLLIMAELTMLLGPYIGVVYGLVIGHAPTALISLLAVALLTINHVMIIQNTSPANVAVALINLPIEVVTTVIVSLVSMVRYEFGRIEWKDRNICIPVMHVVPRLPKLE